MEITEAKKIQINSKVEEVIRTQFRGPKSEVRFFRDRLNFACPYCGDSTNEHKKRANIYWKNLMYHCYNDGCKKHTNLVSFFKDFGSPIKNMDELGFFLDYIRENRVAVQTKDYLEHTTFQNLFDYAIPYEDVKKKLRLLHPSENLTIEKYLKARFMHYKLDHFLYDQKKDQLYLLHLTADKRKVLGWQIRNFDPNRTKYVSFNIEKINYLINDKGIDAPEDEIVKLNTMSLYFGISTVDFTKPVTIFEGVIDSFLQSNSIAITGADKPTEMFDDIPTVRYLFDNDPAGRRIMETKLKRKKKVFMWNKLVRDFKVQEKVKDLNDLFTYCWKRKNDAIKTLDKYFTNEPIDIRNV
jgi:hypothetical protein